jgi:hemerythrin
LSRESIEKKTIAGSPGGILGGSSLTGGTELAGLTWDDCYSVQVRELDDQHKKLIALVRSLHEVMRQGRGKQELNKIFSALVSYTASHFASEERLMKLHGYPEYQAHQDIHAKMTSKALSLQKDFQAGKVGITLDTMNFLEDWVSKHILGTDQKYGPFLNEKGVF